MHGARRRCLAPALVALLISFGCAAASAGPGEPTVAQETLTGTLRSVDVPGGGCEVITGYHMALKLYYVHMGEGTRISMRGESVAMADLKPGQVVRIRYRTSGDRMIAVSLEVLPTQAKGGGDE